MTMQAAQVEEQPIEGQDVDPKVDDQQPPESAPEQAAQSPADDGQEQINKRIGKITAEKWEAKREADALKKQLTELQQKPAEPEAAPTLEQFEFDDAKYQAALIQHQIKQGLAEGKEALRVEQQQAQAQAQQHNVAQAFNAKVADFAASKPDYVDVIGSMPELPGEAVQALMAMDKGPEVAYFLGQNPAVADQVASLDPMSAAIQLGAIQANLSQTKTVKPSSAPEPQETLGGGGAPPKERGPKGAIYE